MNGQFGNDPDGKPATNNGVPYLLSLILGALQTLVQSFSGGVTIGTVDIDQTTPGTTNGVVVNPAVRTNNFHALGASGNFNIPTSAKAWTVTFLTGTGSLGGIAVAAGFSDSSPNSPGAVVAVTTDAASSAYIRYET